jgi:hypothetical protein
LNMIKIRMFVVLFWSFLNTQHEEGESIKWLTEDQERQTHEYIAVVQICHIAGKTEKHRDCHIHIERIS